MLDTWYLSCTCQPGSFTFKTCGHKRAINWPFSEHLKEPAKYPSFYNLECYLPSNIAERNDEITTIGNSCVHMCTSDGQPEANHFPSCARIWLLSTTWLQDVWDKPLFGRISHRPNRFLWSCSKRSQADMPRWQCMAIMVICKGKFSHFISLPFSNAFSSPILSFSSTLAKSSSSAVFLSTSLVYV